MSNEGVKKPYKIIKISTDGIEIQSFESPKSKEPMRIMMLAQPLEDEQEQMLQFMESQGFIEDQAFIYDKRILYALLEDEKSEKSNEQIPKAYLQMCRDSFYGLQVEQELIEQIPKIVYNLKSLRKTAKISEQEILNFYESASSTQEIFKKQGSPTKVQLETGFLDRIYCAILEIKYKSYIPPQPQLPAGQSKKDKFKQDLQVQPEQASQEQMIEDITQEKREYR